MKAYLALGLLSLTVLAEDIKQIDATHQEPLGEIKKEDEHKEIKDETKVGAAWENLAHGEPLPDQQSGTEIMGVAKFEAHADFEKLFAKGACPDIKNMENIQFKRLAGDWYLQRTDEPAVPEMLPSCHHAIFNVNDDGTFTAKEEVRIENQTFVADGITGKFTESTLEGNFMGTKLRVQMEILDTDYDNYLIGYQCYDNIDLALKDEKLEPVHLITVGIAARDPNASEPDLARWEAIARQRAPEMSSDKLATVLSGKDGKCEYAIKADKK